MPNYSTRLSIAKPVIADDFNTAEIAANWQIVDDHPGVHICTSGTRPVWGPSQDGMVISETDTDTLYRWDYNGGPGAWSELHTDAIDDDEVILTMLGIGSAKGDIFVATGANVPSELSVGTDGQVLQAASGETEGVRWHYPSVPVAMNDKTDGDVTITSTSWADIDNALDLTIAAEEDDWLSVGVNALWSNDDDVGRLDAQILESTSYISGQPYGVRSWTGASADYEAIGGEFLHQVVGADINGSGNVVLRLRGHIADTVDSQKVLMANSNSKLQFFVKNLGH